MNTRTCITAAALLSFAALSGCAQRTPHYDNNFGTSVRAAMAAQVADPVAAANPRPGPVTGLDGRAAAAGQARYEQSFTHPEGQQSIVTGQTK